MAKLLVTVFFCVATTVIMVNADAESEIDNENLDQFLSNDKKINEYFNCLMETGPCTQKGEAIKRLFPEAITNECAKCTERQKSRSGIVIKFLYQNKSDLWKQLETKYDPQGLVRKRYTAQGTSA